MVHSEDLPKTSHIKPNLVVDIGNTNVVLAIAQGSTVINKSRLVTNKEATEKEIVIELEKIFQETKLFTFSQQVEYIGLATVVPSLETIWTKALHTFFGKIPFVLEISKCNTFKVDYQVPSQIGPDRLCNVLACQALNIPEAIVVDLGTATTFDIYSQNTYWGGVICPGVLASLKDLSQKASLLSESEELELFWNNNIVGKNTNDALRNGILYGSVGQIEAILKQILVNVPMESPRIIGTGGLSSLIGAKTSMIKQFEKNLTLVGLNYFIHLQTQNS